MTSLVLGQNQNHEKIKIGDKNMLVSKTELIININPYYMGHWLYKGVKERFIAKLNSNFEMHKFCFKNPELAF